jgi:hypothetical protein
MGAGAPIVTDYLGVSVEPTILWLHRAGYAIPAQAVSRLYPGAVIQFSAHRNVEIVQTWTIIKT